MSIKVFPEWIKPISVIIRKPSGKWTEMNNSVFLTKKLGNSVSVINPITKRFWPNVQKGILQKSMELERIVLKFLSRDECFKPFLWNEEHDVTTFQLKEDKVSEVLNEYQKKFGNDLAFVLNHLKEKFIEIPCSTKEHIIGIATIFLAKDLTAILDAKIKGPKYYIDYKNSGWIINEVIRKNNTSLF